MIKTSEIEGERLDREQVRSSIARRLGMDVGALESADRKFEGIVEMMLDATSHFEQPLTVERLFSCHASLFPAGRCGRFAWRRRHRPHGQVVSGPVGNEHIHYEAPAAARLDREIGTFLDWFNSGTDIDPLWKAGLAHLWFVTIHPFDDGNPRIARAIADLVLARSEQSSQRFYSMSSQIRQERAAYYELLERTQKGTLNVTPWLDWFLACLGRAIEGAQTQLGGVLAKAGFRESIADVALNARQRQIVNRLWDGFEGNLTTSKYAKLTPTSQDTALRDISSLVGSGVLVRNPQGGRSTSYMLVRRD